MYYHGYIAMVLWHVYPGEKPQKSIDRKLKQQQEQSSINLVEPNFTMATVIKIGPLEG